jgi:surface antigen
MNEVEAKLESIQYGATTLQSASDHTTSTLTNVRQWVEELVMMGLVGTIPETFYQQLPTLEQLPVTLGEYARTLQTAHDDISAAINGNLAPFVIVEGVAILSSVPMIDPTVSANPKKFSLKLSRRHFGDVAEESIAPVIVPVMAAMTVTPTSYVSTFNQPLMQEWTAQKHTLESATQVREQLTTERAEKVRELNALTNRIRTFNPDANLDQISKVTTLKAELTAIDTQLQGVDAQIATTQHTFTQLDERLRRVLPSAGADLTLIEKMEFSSTPQIVVDNTQDCVNYVVQKFAIPPNMATDAHKWNENLLKLRDYGITSGQVPLEGSVMVMEREHAYGDDTYGHVLYVERVDEAGVWVTDNLHPNEPVLLTELTTETSGQNVSYLYFPWHTKG